MSLFTIADLHLSTLAATNKSMEVFGNRWDAYMQRLERNWRHLIGEEDTVVIPGDISWALTLAEAESDLRFLDSLPGRKILGKGNHDYWWSTMKKHREFFEKCGIETLSFLFNNAFEDRDFIIAGTRSWYRDEDAPGAPDNAEYEKLTRRELQRMQTSLAEAALLQQGAPEKEIVVFTHFPPYYNGQAFEEMIDLFVRYRIRRVYYGHLHGNYTIPPCLTYRDIRFYLISADYLDFTPKIIL